MHKCCLARAGCKARASGHERNTSGQCRRESMFACVCAHSADAGPVFDAVHAPNASSVSESLHIYVSPAVSSVTSPCLTYKRCECAYPAECHPQDPSAGVAHTNACFSTVRAYVRLSRRAAVRAYAGADESASHSTSAAIAAGPYIIDDGCRIIRTPAVGFV